MGGGGCGGVGADDPDTAMSLAVVVDAAWARRERRRGKKGGMVSGGRRWRKPPYLGKE